MNIDWSKAKEDCIGAMVAQFHSRNVYPGLIEFIYKDAKPDALSGHRDCYKEGPDAWLYVPRPAEPTWNGPQDGLPPVGTVCELQDATEVRILAHTKRAGAPVAVYQCTDSESIEAYTASFFRPIGTPEQIAAEERDKAIKKMLGDIKEVTDKVNVNIDCSIAIRSVVEAILDAGYRKVDS
ncbi:hypothetical protein [Pseudomonas sp.]|uniref:hypothetical protein n=1 Tax=Pseudomonas sp. TaxID=306 RepID=UPI00289C9989|nr:hypothetical protein [Pseudomonas sp.]